MKTPAVRAPSTYRPHQERALSTNVLAIRKPSSKQGSRAHQGHSQSCTSRPPCSLPSDHSSWRAFSSKLSGLSPSRGREGGAGGFAFSLPKFISQRPAIPYPYPSTRRPLCCRKKKNHRIRQYLSKLFIDDGCTRLLQAGSAQCVQWEPPLAPRPSAPRSRYTPLQSTGYTPSYWTACARLLPVLLARTTGRGLLAWGAERDSRHWQFR